MSFLKILNLARSKLIYCLGPRPVFYPSLSSVYRHRSSCKFTDFSKKTGDYTSLSAVDIQVMGLAYQLEKEHVGTAHLRSDPIVHKVAKLTEQLQSIHLPISGFYMPPGKKDADVDNNIIIGEGEHLKADSPGILKLEEVTIIDTKRVPELDTVDNDALPEMGNAEGVDSELMQEVMQQERQFQVEMEEMQAVRDMEGKLPKTEDQELPAESGTGVWSYEGEEEDVGHATEGEEGEEDDDDIWDDNAWITPENVGDAKTDIQAAEDNSGPVPVACITSDFAMQNVLRQLGLNAMAADGRVIKQLRSSILRCYACFKTTSKTDLLFCPHCGNRTLHRAAVLLKADGSEEIQISSRRQPTGRGKRFSLPKPKGGKHAVNPILCPDQKMPHLHTTKEARQKNNPLDPDYTAGYSPFVMRDVTSRSAMLGIKNNHTQIKNWMRRNPNEVVKKGKGRKRK